MAARKKSAKKIKRTSAKKTAVGKPKAKRGTGAPRTAAKRVAQSIAKVGPVSVGRKPFTKSELIATLVSQTGIAKKEVVSILDSMSKIIFAHLHKQGPEMFSWPGMLKIKVVKKPATKARSGVNPFTGEPMMYKAKPASRRIKILALKQLKEVVK